MPWMTLQGDPLTLQSHQKLAHSLNTFISCLTILCLWIPYYYLGSFDIDYIIFRNVENSKLEN